MAFKKFDLDGQMSVAVYKRRGISSMKLSVAADNSIRVTIPHWTPYIAGVKFAESRRDWIKRHIQPVALLGQAAPVGKYHHLEFIKHNGTLKTRITSDEVRVYVPQDLSVDSEAVQQKARSACVRALRAEAVKLLPARLAEHAKYFGFTYNKVTIKQMKSRWGSCDSHKNIVLNLYLMQLPWEIIDYVLLHELNHTEHLHHSPEFWDGMENILPDVKALKKAIRAYKPVLNGSATD